MDDYRYTYAVARINALSTKLLDRAFASRMLAASPPEILRLLGETTYAESFAGVDSPVQLDRGLLRELTKTYDLLEKICPDRELMSLFRARYDFHNLKVLLKSRVTGAPHADSLMDLGGYSVGDLSVAVRENDYRWMPAHIRETALEALEEHGKTGALPAISRTCDRLMWQFLMRTALKHRNKIVIELFRESINMENIKAFVRVRQFGIADDFEKHYIPDGTYPLDFFMRHMDEQLGLFLEHLTGTEVERHIAAQGLRTWPEEKSFWRLELAFDNALLHRFWQMRMKLFSIAPLILYLLRKEAETKLIRTVVKGKLVGWSRTQIEERLRYLYV
ncbi:MAG: V-type ATP synthase subunit C [Candidatus Abyssubacteria bacterium]